MMISINNNIGNSRWSFVIQVELFAIRCFIVNSLNIISRVIWIWNTKGNRELSHHIQLSINHHKGSASKKANGLPRPTKAELDNSSYSDSTLTNAVSPSSYDYSLPKFTDYNCKWSSWSNTAVARRKLRRRTLVSRGISHFTRILQSANLRGPLRGCSSSSSTGWGVIEASRTVSRLMPLDCCCCYCRGGLYIYL